LQEFPKQNVALRYEMTCFGIVFSSGVIHVPSVTELTTLPAQSVIVAVGRSPSNPR
jgi:hypothetical protein